jgi:hypothetical protein
MFYSSFHCKRRLIGFSSVLISISNNRYFSEDSGRALVTSESCCIWDSRNKTFAARQHQQLIFWREIVWQLFLLEIVLQLSIFLREFFLLELFTPVTKFKNTFTEFYIINFIVHTVLFLEAIFNVGFSLNGSEIKKTISIHSLFYSTGERKNWTFFTK